MKMGYFIGKKLQAAIRRLGDVILQFRSPNPLIPATTWKSMEGLIYISITDLAHSSQDGEYEWREGIKGHENGLICGENPIKLFVLFDSLTLSC